MKIQIEEADLHSVLEVLEPAQPIRWDSNAVDMTGAMATLPKTGSKNVVDYKPVISNAGADAIEAKLKEKNQ